MMEREERCFPSGTFKIGQEPFHIIDEEHTYYFHKDCNICGSKGTVLLSGQKFVCPYCKGIKISKTVIRKRYEKADKVKSIISFKSRNKAYEYYTNDSSPNGWLYLKGNDGETRFFATEEEAKNVCDKYNSENNVDFKIQEYNRIKLEQELKEER